MTQLDSRRSRLGVYAMQSVRSLASGLAGVFIPVYLLQHGAALTTVFGYYLAYYVVTFATTQISGWTARRINLKWLMVASVVPQVASLLLLVHGGSGAGFVYGLAVLQAVAAGWYWLPLHVFFATASSKDGVGGQVGKFLAIPQVAGLATPLVAGAVAQYMGFGAVFGAAAVLYALSAGPLFMVSAYSAPPAFSWRRFRGYFGRYRLYLIAEVFENIGEEMDQIIWPLAIYLALHNLLSLGAADSLLGAMSALMVCMLGKRANQANRFRILQLGGVVMTALWVARYFTHSTTAILVVTALAGLGQWLIMVPFNAVIYDLAREDENTLEFILFREFPVFIARVGVFAIGIVVAGGNIERLFWFGLVAYGFFWLAPRLKPGLSVRERSS